MDMHKEEKRTGEETRFYIGCPMWGYKAWVGSLFPARTPNSEFLRIYSRRLTCVEGNTTFYAVPSAETVARWREETPASFRICPKVARSISHEADLASSQRETLAFVERMRGLGSRLGPMFLQLPPHFGPDELPQLVAFLAFWPAEQALAVEVRHPDFFQEPHASALNDLLREHKVARILMDTRPIRVGSAKEQEVLQARERKPNLPLHIIKTADFVFVRYIGNPQMEVNAGFLDEWARQLAQWHQEGATLYVFCHCPFEEHSPFICAELYKRVQVHIALPELPWHAQQERDTPEQARLF